MYAKRIDGLNVNTILSNIPSAPAVLRVAAKRNTSERDSVTDIAEFHSNRSIATIQAGCPHVCVDSK